MLVEELLELIELFVVLEVGEGMSFFLCRDLHASDDEHALLASDLLRHLHLSGGVVVAYRNHVEMQLLRLFHDGSGRHIDVAARREHRVNMQVRSVLLEFHHY